MSNKTNNRFLRRFRNYLFIGVAAFSTELLTFLGLLTLTSSLISAQSFSFIAGLIVSFTGNRMITFSSHSRVYVMDAKQQLISYVSLAIINLLLTNLVIHGLVGGHLVPVLVAKVAVMVMVVGWNYLIFNRYIFKSK